MTIEENPNAAILYAVITSCLLYSVANYVLYASAAAAVSAAAFLAYRYSEYCMLTLFAWCGYWYNCLIDLRFSVHHEGNIFSMPGAYPIILSSLDLPYYLGTKSEEVLKLQRRNHELEAMFLKLEEDSWSASQDWARRASQMMAEHRSKLEKAIADNEASWQQKWVARDHADTSIVWQEKFEGLRAQLRVQAPLLPTPSYTIVPTPEAEVDTLREELKSVKAGQAVHHDEVSALNSRNSTLTTKITGLTRKLRNLQAKRNAEMLKTREVIRKVTEINNNNRVCLAEAAEREKAAETEIADLKGQLATKDHEYTHMREWCVKQLADMTEKHRQETIQREEKRAHHHAMELQQHLDESNGSDRPEPGSVRVQLAANAISQKDAELESMRSELAAANQKLEASGTGALFEELTTVKKDLVASQQLKEQYLREGGALFEAHRQLQQAKKEIDTTLDTARDQYQQLVASATTREQALISVKNGAEARVKELCNAGQSWERERDDLKEKLGEVEKERDELKEKLSEAEKQCDEFDLDLDLSRSDCKNTQEELEEVQAEHAALVATKNELQTQIEVLTKRCNGLPTDDESLKKKYRNLQAETDYLSSDRQRLDDELFKTIGLVTKVTNDLTTAQTDLRRVQAELEELKTSGGSSGELEGVKIELWKSQGELATANAELEVLKNGKLGIVKGKLDQLEAEHKEMRNERDALRQHNNKLTIRNNKLEKEGREKDKELVEKDKKLEDMELFG